MVVLAIALTQSFGAVGTSVAVSVVFIIVSVLLLTAIRKHVLHDPELDTTFGKVAITGLVAACACGIGILAAAPRNPNAIDILIAASTWIGTVSVLFYAVGGRKALGMTARQMRKLASKRE